MQKSCDPEIYVIQAVLRMGVRAAAHTAVEHLRKRYLDRAWMLVDLDVLDQTVMSAVDSPGGPGLKFAQLSSLIDALLESNRFIGAAVTIYDPERDPTTAYADRIVATLGQAFERLIRSELQRGQNSGDCQVKP